MKPPEYKEVKDRRLLVQSPVHTILENDGAVATLYKTLCDYTHARPTATDGALWESNGPVYDKAAIELVITLMLRAYIVCFALIRLARPEFAMPVIRETLESRFTSSDASISRLLGELF